MTDSTGPSDAAEREREVRSVLRLMGEFGTATERFFGRVYRGLDRKQTGTPSAPPAAPGTEPDALRQMNRELLERAREAQAMALQLQSVFQNISEGVIVQDVEGRLQFVNDAAYRLLGSIKAFWESELGRMFEKLRDLPPRVSEIEPLGAPIRVQVNNRILGAQVASVGAPDGTPLGSLIILRDVTKEALADRLKDEFITQITHELRTPLTAIKGMSEVLLSQPGDRPPNRKFLEAIGRNAAILDRMIIELLDISEITAGSFQVRQQDISLIEMVQDIIKGEEPRTRKSNIRVNVMVASHQRARIVGDDRRLRWAVGHLIDNGINYTPLGGKLSVRVGLIKGDRVLVQVQDSGVGISNRDLPHIFERFYRGEARTTDGRILDPRGLGQGLYIARAVAEAHGGYLVVSSTPGEGSQFTMGLPFAPPQTG
jgi:two-component system phosphate regulon sensor histidine kinase PhoR